MICKKNKDAWYDFFQFFQAFLISAAGSLLASKKLKNIYCGKNSVIIRWPPPWVTALQVVRTSFLGSRPRLFLGNWLSVLVNFSLSYNTIFLWSLGLYGSPVKSPFRDSSYSNKSWYQKFQSKILAQFSLKSRVHSSATFEKTIYQQWNRIILLSGLPQGTPTS